MMKSIFKNLYKRLYVSVLGQHRFKQANPYYDFDNSKFAVTETTNYFTVLPKLGSIALAALNPMNWLYTISILITLALTFAGIGIFAGFIDFAINPR
ncbi:hypothetical protein ACTTZI_004167 [Vibrio vulnificus]